MEVLRRAPYSYNSWEEESIGEEDEIAKGDDRFGKYAKLPQRMTNWMGIMKGMWR